MEAAIIGLLFISIALLIAAISIELKNRSTLFRLFDYNEEFLINKFNSLKFQNKIIMKTIEEHAAELRAVTEQNNKSRAEVLQKFLDLETAIANSGKTTPEVDEAMAALKASVQTDDDMIPDPPPPPPGE